MNKQERAILASQVLNNECVKEAISEMERRALDDFVHASRWWWGDRRRRLAAEHIREVRDFRNRLEAQIRAGAPERIRTIA